MTYAVVLGIDPGKSTGLCLCVGPDVIRAMVLEAQGSLEQCDPSMPNRAYLGELASWIEKLIDTGMDHGVTYTGIAVEGLVAPNAYHKGGKQFVAPTVAMAPSYVLGMVMTLWPSAVVVRPGGNGAKPLHAYPDAIVGHRERTGGGRLRHARAAYDVAQQYAYYRRAQLSAKR